MSKGVSPSQLFGIGLSFGVTMIVSIFITTKIGSWIDEKLGLHGVFFFIGLLMGIFSGFRLLMENIAALDRPRGRELDALDEQKPKE